MEYPELGLPRCTGQYRLGGESFRLRVEEFLNQELDPLSSWGGAGFISELQAFRDQAVGLGLPHRPGRYRPGGILSSPSALRSCRDMEGFLNRALALCTRLSQSAIGRWGWGSTLCDAVPTRGIFVPGLSEF